MPERYEDIARAALLEITTADTVGDYVGLLDEGENAYSVQFASTKPGYPNWRWTVSIAHLPDQEPSVLEAELMPDEGALLAPDWVPWADRLADWEAGQAGLAAEDDDESEDSDDDDDDDDDDASDDDVLDDDEALLHSGDLDGVDIDDLDEDSDEDDDDDDESDEDDGSDEEE